MASGRRDYTWGFFNETVGSGRYTTEFFKWFSENVPGSIQLEIYSYTVPDNYRLGINRINVSTNSGILDIIQINIDGVIYGLSFFSEKHSFEISDLNPLYVGEGKSFKVLITNLDTVGWIFHGSVVGVLEYTKT